MMNVFQIEVIDAHECNQCTKIGGTLFKKTTKSEKSIRFVCSILTKSFFDFFYRLNGILKKVYFR